MPIDQTQVQSLLQFLFYIAHKHAPQRDYTVRVPVWNFMEAWSAFGGNGEEDSLAKCLEHIKETPFEIKNSNGTRDYAFVTHYEFIDDSIRISFNDDYVKNFLIKAAEEQSMVLDSVRSHSPSS